jgi:hypothetical protein
VNENSNPNGGGKLPNNDNSMMKIGGGSAATATRRPPPPRASLITSRPKFNRTSPSIIAPSQANAISATETLVNDASVSNRSALVLNVTDNNGAVDEKEEDLSLWVVGYGKLLSITLSLRSYTSTPLLLVFFRNYNTFFSINPPHFSFNVCTHHT